MFGDEEVWQLGGQRIGGGSRGDLSHKVNGRNWGGGGEDHEPGPPGVRARTEGSCEEVRRGTLDAGTLGGAVLLTGRSQCRVGPEETRALSTLDSEGQGNGGQTEALERTDGYLLGELGVCECWRAGSIWSRSRGVVWLGFSERSVHAGDRQEGCRRREESGRLPGWESQTKMVEVPAPHPALVGMRGPSGLWLGGPTASSRKI